MTNTEAIVFKAKYSVSYMNKQIVIMGFNTQNVLSIPENTNMKQIEGIFEDIVSMNESEWKDFVNYSRLPEFEEFIEFLEFTKPNFKGSKK